VALCLDREVEEPVPRDLIEHVGEEGEGGRDLGAARAVEVDGHGDAGLVRLPLHAGATVGHGGHGSTGPGRPTRLPSARAPACATTMRVKAHALLVTALLAASAICPIAACSGSSIV